MFQRQTSGSVVCPSCGKLVGINDKECYNCGRRNPGMWGFAPALRRIGLDLGFTQIVFTTCVAMYAVSLLSDWQNIGSGGFSFLSPSTRSLFLFGAAGALPVFEAGRWWTVLSASWLHGGILHIFFNLYWLRQIMPLVEESYGVGRLIIIYTVSSITGFGVTSYLGTLGLPFPLNGAPFITIGASAPLFGLFGALIVYGNRTGQTTQSAEIWRWVLIFVVIGVILPVIDNGAHLGGLAGGYAAARVMDPLEPESGNHLLLALLCLVLTAASIIASVLLGVPLFLGRGA